MSVERTFAEAEVFEQLATLPGWSLRGGAIERSFRTASFKSSLMVATTIGHLCEAAWHHPEMTVSFNTVVVRLWTHSAKGITKKDFELASRIEDVICWQPGKAGGALTGPPSDARHAYVRHE